MMAWSTASTPSSYLHGVLMLTCSTLCHGTKSSNTAPLYVTKSEPRSQSLKDVFTTIVHSLKEGNNCLKAVQKLLINTVGEQDYSAQETCHLLLQVPMFKASRDFIILSLDGSRAVEDRLDEEQHATAPSTIVRPTTVPFNNITLLEFSRQYTMPKTLLCHLITSHFLSFLASTPCQRHLGL